MPPDYNIKGNIVKYSIIYYHKGKRKGDIRGLVMG